MAGCRPVFTQPSHRPRQSACAEHQLDPTPFPSASARPASYPLLLPPLPPLQCLRSAGFCWTPILHCGALKKSKSEHHWVVGLTPTQLMCILCKGEDKVPATLPRPVLQARRSQHALSTPPGCASFSPARPLPPAVTLTPFSTHSLAVSPSPLPNQPTPQSMPNACPSPQPPPSPLQALPLGIPLAVTEVADASLAAQRMSFTPSRFSPPGPPPRYPPGCYGGRRRFPRGSAHVLHSLPLLPSRPSPSVSPWLLRRPQTLPSRLSAWRPRWNWTSSGWPRRRRAWRKRTRRRNTW
jgi:hypothetical protein